jgi:1,4-dihydroxy-2-naphthoyl-CoA hydrolase
MPKLSPQGSIMFFTFAHALPTLNLNMMNLHTSLEEFNKMNTGTLVENLGIEYTDISEGLVCAKMPVDKRTFRPGNILHGGANVALAETIGGLGSYVLIDNAIFDVRGSQISANHTGSANSGWVFGRAEIIHQGKRTHVWNIDIRDENQRLISTVRLTNFIVRK